MEAGDVDRSLGVARRALDVHLQQRLLPQVLRPLVLQLQLVGQSQNADVGGGQTRVVAGLLGELGHWRTSDGKESTNPASSENVPQLSSSPTAVNLHH